MKITITLGFLLGVCFTILIASTTDVIQVFKPAVPTSVYVRTYRQNAFDSPISPEIKKDIVTMGAQGYILKDIYTMSNGFTFIVVMEKY